MMLAERAADHILGRGLLPAEPAPFYVALNWQSAQR
jgi:choline dehydrogenase